MPQSAEKILDHELLFREPEYRQLMAGKKQFECGHAQVRVDEIANWTKGQAYREKNFARDMDMAIASPVWKLTKAPWKN